MIALRSSLGSTAILTAAGCTTLSLPPEGPTGPPPQQATASALEAVTHAETLYAQGQYGQAQTAFSALVESHPRNAYFWFRLGNCEAQLQRYPQAIAAFQRARSLDPHDARFTYNLAYAHGAMARDAFAQAREQLPLSSALRREAEQNLRLMEAAVGSTQAPLSRGERPLDSRPTAPPHKAR